MAFATLRQAGVPAQGRPELVTAKRKAHVCFVAPYAWPVLSRDPNIQVVGGAEVQQCILARLLAANGYRVSMISLDYGQPSPALVDGITVYKSFREDAGVPVLRFLQIGQEQIVLGRDRWLYRRGLARVDRIVAQNPFQIESCRRNHKRDATLIPSCYELPKEAKPGNGDRVLWVGTIHSYKRPHWLLDIAERLPERRFVVIGGPSVGGERLKPGYYEEVRDRAAHLPNVEFTGFLPLAQVEPWFDRARLLVSTSVYEGMPNVFLQAWARAVPTVATVDVGAPVNTVFADAEQGAAKVEALLSDTALWNHASSDSLAYFERNHSSSEVLARYARLLEELRA